MSTGIESWTPVKEVAALSPFSGWEVIDHHCGAVLWIGWQIWQIKSENAGYDEQVAKLQGNLSKAVSGD